MKAVWLGYGFGLIDAGLLVSDWLTCCGVYSFGAEMVAVVDPCSKGVAVFKWVGSTLLNTNFDLYGNFADFNSRVGGNKATKNFVDPFAVWATCERFSNRLFYHTWVDFNRGWLRWVFLIRDTLEMWSFPFEGGGDDTDMDTTLVGIFLYSENVCISGVLALDYLLGRDYICLSCNYPCLGLLVRCIWLVAWIQARLGFDPLASPGHPRKYPCYLKGFETYYEWWMAWTPKRWIVSTLTHVSGITTSAAHTIKVRDASCTRNKEAELSA